MVLDILNYYDAVVEKTVQIIKLFICKDGNYKF